MVRGEPFSPLVRSSCKKRLHLSCETNSLRRQLEVWVLDEADHVAKWIRHFGHLDRATHVLDLPDQRRACRDEVPDDRVDVGDTPVGDGAARSGPRHCVIWVQAELV